MQVGAVGVLGLMAMALGLIGLGTTLALMVLPWLLEPLLDRLTRSRPGLLRVRDGRLWLSWSWVWWSMPCSSGGHR